MSHRHDHDDPDSPRGKIAVPANVQDAIRTLIQWAGDDPQREGLIDTPQRVGRAWKEYCQGYLEDPAIHLSRQFEEVGGYDELVLQIRSAHVRTPVTNAHPVCRPLLEKKKR